MARPHKKGLDYFPVDVDIFNDDKLMFVSARFEEKGELIVIKLLCKIYREGYFIYWNEDTAMLFSKVAGKGITHCLANDVVNELVKRRFFDKTLFDRFSVLTSYGIQKRYIKICKDAKRVIDFNNMEYGLFGLNEPSKQLTPEKTEFPPEETKEIPRQSTQRKEKKSKVKEEEYTTREIKEIFIADNELLRTWMNKPLPENKFENGIDVFLSEQIEESYPTWNKLRQHFIYWMPNYYKATEKMNVNNGAIQPQKDIYDHLKNMGL